MTPAATRMLRAAAARRLLELDAAGQPTAGHVPPAASSVGLSERTMWRWLGRFPGLDLQCQHCPGLRRGLHAPWARMAWTVDP
jgi:hypothetical protein